MPNPYSYRLKASPLRASEIANWLNTEGELSPSEYRRSFNKNDKYSKNILWSHTAVNDILNNLVYTGVLIYGKTTTPNYKIRKSIKKPKDEWHIIQNAHEPIISKIDFEIMQFVLKQRNQHIKSTKTIHPLAGFLNCYDCGNRMVRATFTHSNANEKCVAYICAANQKGVCTSHYIREFNVGNTVTEAIARQIAFVMDIKEKFEHIKALPCDRINLPQMNDHLLIFKDKIKECKDLKRTLFDDYQKGIISKDDYILFGEEYTIKLNELNKKTAEYKEVTEMMINLDTSIDRYLDHYLQFKDFKEINRTLTANLLERIDVTQDKHLLIRFRFQDKFEMIKEFIDKLLDTN